MRAVANLAWSAVSGVCLGLAACAAGGGGNEDGADAHPLSGARIPAPRGKETIFSPLNLPAPTTTRTIRGQPGPDYWQNETIYSVNAILDADHRTVSVDCRVLYINNSPHALDFLWLHLEQNLYTLDSEGAALTRPGDRFGNHGFDGGFEIARVWLPGYEIEASFEEHGTLGKLTLPSPLGPNHSVEFEMRYTFKIPEYGSDRMGIRECKDGDVFEIAQWLPQVCKFDDVHGWNTLPYLGDGEFYTDFGEYTVSITVPPGFLVAATGVLENPRDVLSPRELSRFEEAQRSTEPVVIRETGDSSPSSTAADSTWRFSATRVRTFAFAASRAFGWDACTLTQAADAGATSGGEPVFCQSFYPSESAQLWSPSGAGGGSTRMLRDSIAHYSERWFPYPYPSASNVSGLAGGMEYPAIIFCQEDEDEFDLWEVLTHEIGHTWFPMLVNTDERRCGWMDEGFNTFINHYATQERYPDKTVSDAIEDFAKGERGDAARGGKRLFQPVNTPADLLAPGTLGRSQYYKPAAALVMLREGILGPERFDAAFKQYINRWAFKSPQPADFFRTMEDVGGMDLDWFFRGYFYETGTLNQAVTTVTQAESARGGGGAGSAGGGRNCRVTFRNRGELVAPIVYDAEYDDGEVERRRIPVEAWASSDEWQATWDTKGRKLKRITIDPDGVFIDVDRSNNHWKK